MAVRASRPKPFGVTREHGTERAFTSPLNDEKRKGVFACVGCGKPLFTSTTKFKSGTGWPSFFTGCRGGGEQDDHSRSAMRNEVDCRRCRAHLGHVFPDGPKPSGLRYCMNRRP